MQAHKTPTQEAHRHKTLTHEKLGPSITQHVHRCALAAFQAREQAVEHRFDLIASLFHERFYCNSRARKMEEDVACRPYLFPRPVKNYC